MANRYFKNVSGKNYILNEVGDRRIGSDKDKIIYFSDEEIESCSLLSVLIKNGSFKEVNRDFAKKEEAEKVFNRLDDLSSDDNKETNMTNEENCDAFSFGSVEKKPEETKKVSKNSSDLKDLYSVGDKELWWTGPAVDMGGYGKMNKYCLSILYDKDYKIQLEMANIPNARAVFSENKKIKEMMSNEVSKNSTSVWAMLPPKFPTRKSSKKVYFTMIESCDVHQSFLDKVKMCDELWLPSKFNYDIFKEKNLNCEISHIPLGVDQTIYKPLKITKEHENSFNIEKKDFVFVSVFGWSLRKGVDVLLKSYLEEFSEKDNTTLILVSRLNGSTSYDSMKKIRETIKEYIKRCCPDPSKSPHIVHFGSAVPEEKMPIIYNMSDCFVLPSRGEGMGLPYMEAAACGLPVIATRCGGQLDFLTDEDSYLLDIEGYDIANQEIKEISSYYEDVPFAVLGQKCVNQLKEFMRNIYSDPLKSKEKSRKLMEKIRNNYRWEDTVDKIIKRL